jgi:hypothetical protein
MIASPPLLLLLLCIAVSAEIIRTRRPLDSDLATAMVVCGQCNEDEWRLVCLAWRIISTWIFFHHVADRFHVDMNVMLEALATIE